MTNRLELNWKLDGFVDEQRYYCSETPFTVETKPAPKAVLAGDVRTYIDHDIEAEKNYSIAIGSVRNNREKLSLITAVSTKSNPILKLFSNNEKGLWFDFSDISTLFQDTVGLVNLTAIDQPIARVNDKSGNGNHAAQSDSTKRPLFKADGALYDAVNDLLSTLNPVDYGGSNTVEIYVKIKGIYRASKAYNCVFESGNRFNTSGKVGYISMSREENFSITAATISSTPPNFVLYAGNNQSYDGVYSLRITPTSITIDAESPSTSTINKPQAFTNEILYIGGRSTIDTFSGYIKHLVIVNRSTTQSERDSIVQYLNEN